MVAINGDIKSFSFTFSAYKIEVKLVTLNNFLGW